MTDYSCPLCTETYDEQTTLHIHLEVEHRKSEIVSSLIDTLADTPDSTIETDRRLEQATPPV